MRMKDHRGRFVPFSITFVKCDSHKKEGGQLVTYNHVTLPQRTIVELETMERKSQSRKEVTDTSQFSTVTFKKDGEFRQAHIHLITRFNGETVI